MMDYYTIEIWLTAKESRWWRTGTCFDTLRDAAGIADQIVNPTRLVEVTSHRRVVQQDLVAIGARGPEGRKDDS